MLQPYIESTTTLSDKSKALAGYGLACSRISLSLFNFPLF